MTRWSRLLVVAALLGCSDLTENDGGVIALEVRGPTAHTLEVGQSVQLQARALDRNGDSIGAPVVWRSADSIVAVDSAGGLATALFPGSGRVQASIGSLTSTPIQFTVTARADTLIVVDTVPQTVPAEADLSAPLAVRVETRTPPGPLAGVSVIYTVVEPAFLDPATRTVELTGGVLADTVTTGADGTPTPPITIGRVPNVPAPDSAIVEVSALQSSGTPVPGSGQRLIIRFAPRP